MLISGAITFRLQHANSIKTTRVMLNLPENNTDRVCHFQLTKIQERNTTHTVLSPASN
jgi:hypothetical protein